MLSHIRSFARKIPFLKKVIGYYIAPSGLFDKTLLNRPLGDLWQRRLNETIECPDNEFIPRVENAGTVSGGKQVLHNGLKIHLGSYYGPEVAQILQANRGVHEPQEERVFQEVIASLPAGATMIELGSFWSFYSMWFHSVVPQSRNFMIEPDKFNKGCGERNFKLNGMQGDFTLAMIADKSSVGPEGRTVCVDDFVAEKGIEHISLLHSDIQGFEYLMLQGADSMLDAGKIDFIFISTHSNEVHAQCLNHLLERDFFIIAETDRDGTYSEDGLIAACAPHVDWKQKIEISQKPSSST